MAQFRAPRTQFKRLSFPNSFKIQKPDLTHVVNKLNVRVLPEARKFPRRDEGLTGRLKAIRMYVSALVKHERIEVLYHRGDEARGYTERLISEAIRFGPTHKPTMDLAKWWITDEAAVPKLFEVLVPRFQEWPSGLPYTRMLRLPSTIKSQLNFQEAGMQGRRGVLELRGNPYPELPGPVAKAHPGQIHNVLLEEARKEYFRRQSRQEQEAEQTINAVPVPEEEDEEPEDASHSQPEDISPPKN